MASKRPGCYGVRRRRSRTKGRRQGLLWYFLLCLVAVVAFLVGIAKYSRWFETMIKEDEDIYSNESSKIRRPKFDRPEYSDEDKHYIDKIIDDRADSAIGYPS